MKRNTIRKGKQGIRGQKKLKKIGRPAEEQFEAGYSAEQKAWKQQAQKEIQETMKTLDNTRSRITRLEREIRQAKSNIDLLTQTSIREKEEEAKQREIRQKKAERGALSPEDKEAFEIEQDLVKHFGVAQAPTQRMKARAIEIQRLEEMLKELDKQKSIAKNERWYLEKLSKK